MRRQGPKGYRFMSSNQTRPSRVSAPGTSSWAWPAQADTAGATGATRRMQRPLRRCWRWWPIAALVFAEVVAAQSGLLSRQNVRIFRQGHPCPLTGLTRNACPGWTVALVTPRCAGGSDDAANMQWLTTLAAATKDDAERRQCPPVAAVRPAR